MSEVLARGDYVGSDDDVLTVCKEEINDGAADVIRLADSTPLGKLVEASLVAQLRHTATTIGSDRPHARTRP